MRRFATASALACLALAGCTIGPKYERPVAPMSETYRGGAAETESVADLSWWELYQDPVLQELITAALENNQDLKVAVARIEQARAIAAQTNAVRYPQIGYDGAVSRGRNEFAGQPTYNAGQTYNSFAGVLSAAWEFDLWGRLRNLNTAALEDALATEQVRNAVRLSLVSDVAQAYFELLELDDELRIHRAAVESFTETKRIFSLRLEFGTSSNLEVARAEAALAQSAADIPRTQLAQTLKEDQISVLLGRPAAAIPRGQTMLEQRVPPEVPAGIPAQILDRRPDILAAEARIRAANARIGAAQALKLPQIGLTTFLGEVNPDLSTINGGSGFAWSIAASIAGPIFDAGLTDAQIAQAQAEWKVTVAQYDGTVLAALAEVADALASRMYLEGLRSELAKSVAAYEESVDVAMKRYMAGKSSYYEVLEAQQRLFPTEVELAQAQVDQLVAIVRLYKSLGGGWNLADESWTHQEDKQAAQPSE